MPFDCVPTSSDTLPSSSNRSSAPSFGAPRAVSMKHVTPMPRSLCRCCDRLASRGKPGMVRRGDRIVEIVGEPAAIDDGAKRLAIGKLAHQVAPAQLDRIEPAAPRGLVDQALDHVVHFRLAGAAIGVDRHGVGEHAVHVHEDRRNDVAAAHRVGRRVGGTARAAGRQIGTEIGHGGDVQREETAVRIQRQPRARHVVAALRGGDEVLGALAHPFDRPAERARRPQQHHPFGIQRVLHAEAAADIGHATCIRSGGTRNTLSASCDCRRARRRRRTADGSRRASCRPIAPRGSSGGDDEPIVDQLHFDDMRRAGDRACAPRPGRPSGSDRTDCPAPAPTIAARPSAMPPGASTTDGNGRQSTATSSAASRAAARVSATTNATGSPTWRTRPEASARRGGTIIGARLATWTMHGSGPRSREVGGGEDAQHAGNLTRRGGVDPLDHCVRVRRAHDLHQVCAGDIDVLDVAARARSGSAHPRGEAVTGRGRTWLILNAASAGCKPALFSLQGPQR